MPANKLDLDGRYTWTALVALHGMKGGDYHMRTRAAYYWLCTQLVMSWRKR